MTNQNCTILYPKDSIPCIVINWNGYHNTVECLEALLTQKEVKANIHVLDNNSSDQEYERLQARFGDKGINFHYSDVNIGFTRGCNLLIQKLFDKWQKSDVKYVFLINNDAVPSLNCLKALKSHIDMNKVDLVSCKMLDYYRRTIIDNLGHKMLRSGEIVPIKSESTINEYSNFGPCAGAGLYSVTCLREIGLFDEYFNTGYEDAELGFRAKLTQCKVSFAPKALVYHKGGGSIKKVFNENYSIKNQKNILYTIVKLYPGPLLFIMLPFIILRQLTAILISFLFLKFNYSKILFVSYRWFFLEDFRRAIRSRKEFKRERIIISSLSLFKSQFSALIFDIKRAYRYLVKRNKSSLDQYR